MRLDRDFGGTHTDRFHCLFLGRPGRRGTPEIRPACGRRSSDAAHDDTFRQTMEEVKGISGGLPGIPGAATVIALPGSGDTMPPG